MELQFASVKENLLNYLHYFHVCQAHMPSIKLSLLFKFYFKVKSFCKTKKVKSFVPSELSFLSGFIKKRLQLST